MASYSQRALPPLSELKTDPVNITPRRSSSPAGVSRRLQAARSNSERGARLAREDARITQSDRAAPRRSLQPRISNYSNIRASSRQLSLAGEDQESVPCRRNPSRPSDVAVSGRTRLASSARTRSSVSVSPKLPSRAHRELRSRTSSKALQVNETLPAAQSYLNPRASVSRPASKTASFSESRSRAACEMPARRSLSAIRARPNLPVSPRSPTSNIAQSAKSTTLLQSAMDTGVVKDLESLQDAMESFEGAVQRCTRFNSLFKKSLARLRQESEVSLAPGAHDSTVSEPAARIAPQTFGRYFHVTETESPDSHHYKVDWDNELADVSRVLRSYTEASVSVSLLAKQLLAGVEDAADANSAVDLPTSPTLCEDGDFPLFSMTLEKELKKAMENSKTNQGRFHNLEGPQKSLPEWAPRVLAQIYEPVVLSNQQNMQLLETKQDSTTEERCPDCEWVNVVKHDVSRKEEVKTKDKRLKHLVKKKLLNDHGEKVEPIATSGDQPHVHFNPTVESCTFPHAMDMAKYEYEADLHLHDPDVDPEVIEIFHGEDTLRPRTASSSSDNGIRLFRRTTRSETKRLNPPQSILKAESLPTHHDTEHYFSVIEIQPSANQKRFIKNIPRVIEFATYAEKQLGMSTMCPVGY